MICEKCARETDDRKEVVTKFHVWMKLCPACREKHAMRDAEGKIVFFEESPTHFKGGEK